MSLRALDWALHVKIAPAPKVALMVLANCMNDETGKCCPSQAFIAERVGCSERTVRNYLQELEAAGLVTRVDRRHPVSGARLSNGYLLHVDERAERPAEALPAESSGRTPRKPRLPGPPESVSAAEPEVEPESLSLRAGARERKPVSYNGRRVPWATVNAAERLLAHFGEKTGSKHPPYTVHGKVRPELRQIIGALLDRDDVGEERWRRAIDNTVANPPDWVEGGKVRLGHVFGARAAQWALENAGAGVTRSEGSVDFLESINATVAKRNGWAHAD